MAKQKLTDEEKVALKIVDLISDIRLDLDLIGLYFVQFARKADFLRFEHIFHSAVDSHNAKTDRNAHYERLHRMGEPWE